MKRPLITILTILFSLSTFAEGIFLNGEEYSIDTLRRYQVGPGTWYTQVRMLRLRDGGNRRDVYILQRERKNPYVTTHTVLGRDSIIGGECPSTMAIRKTTPELDYFAGTNGDWWSTQRPGVPEGCFATEGEVAITPGGGRNGLAMCAIDDKDSLYYGHDLCIDFFISSNNLSRMRCSHVNDIRYDNELVFYNKYEGKSTHTDNSGTEVLCKVTDNSNWSLNTVKELEVVSVNKNTGNLAIPDGHIVLSGVGSAKTLLEQLTEGEKITLEVITSINGIVANFKACLGGQARSFMLSEGEVDNNWDENHPRTGLGLSQTGDTIIHCVVDGRGKSLGATTGVLAEIMRYFGAWWAMNMEGGGSSSMNIRQVGVQNKCSDGYERAESQGIFEVSSAPKDNTVAKISLYTHCLRLPKHGYVVPKFLAYNQYGDIISTDLQGVTLSCEPATGNITNGGFEALADGILTATYQSVSAQIPVIISTDMDISFVLDSVWVSDDVNYQVQTRGIQGVDTAFLLPQALNWQIEDESIASISTDGFLVGLQNGVTRVFGNVGNFFDTLVVTVEIPEESVLLWDDMQNADARWNMQTSSDDWNAAFSTDSEGLAQLTIQYKSVRGASIKFYPNIFLFGLPKTMQISFNPHDFPLTSITVGLRARGQLTANTYTEQNIIPEYNNIFQIDIDSLFGVHNDVSIFPVELTNITLAIKTKEPVKDYSISFRGIILNYTDVTIGVENIYRNRFSTDGLTRVYDLQGNQYLCIAKSLNLVEELKTLPAGNYIIQTPEQTYKINLTF